MIFGFSLDAARIASAFPAPRSSKYFKNTIKAFSDVRVAVLPPGTLQVCSHEPSSIGGNELIAYES
jgi:hypothetical protein